MANKTLLTLPLGQSICRAVEFLRIRQLPHGEFPNFLGANATMSAPAFDSCVFSTSFAIDALAYVEELDVTDMIDRAAAFLESEMEFGGVWRYWSTRDHKHSRLPPDLDDTACISYALKRAGRKPPGNAWILRCSRDSHGRFRTWVLPTRRNIANLRFLCARGLGRLEARLRTPKTPETEDPRFRVMHIDRADIDPVVNANVLLYLGERPETLAALEFVIDTVRKAPEKVSLYYGHLAFYHAVARAFRHAAPRLGVVAEQIVRHTLQLTGGPEGTTPLSAALAASVLLTFAPDNSSVVDLLQQILRTQRPDGGWGLYSFYSNVWGSEELTTGFCLEALALAQRLVSGATP